MELRKGITPHSTATSEGDWDGPANEARLKLDQDEAYYRKAFAWQDPEGNPKTKSAYKFIHHEVDSEGNIGPANIRACQTGIGALNGARGGTNIPDADRQGVYNHLARHIRDADLEPPELRRAKEQEIHTFGVRQIGVEAGKIIGYAAVFNVLSAPMGIGGWQERIRPGAFRKTIQESDIWSFWAHNPALVLGRKRAGTLNLREDNEGLAFEITPPKTSWADDAIESIRRGDVDQCSFGFTAIKDNWITEEEGKTIRDLLEVRLFEISPTPMAAYPQTSVTVRHYMPEPSLAGHSGGNRGNPPEVWQLPIGRRKQVLEFLLKENSK